MLLTLAACCALACAGLFAATARGARAVRHEACAGENLRPAAANQLAVDLATLCLLNRIRAAAGMHPLQANRDLVGVAAGQLNAMLSMDYFADVRPTGETPLSLVDRTPYRARAASVSIGEDLAWGSGPSSTPARIVAALMASAPHRDLILQRGFKDAGIAVLPRVPRVLARRGHCAIYAIEFAARS